MRYRTLSNSPIERTVVTDSHVKWQNSFTTDELDKIVAYCDSVGTERAKVIGVDENNIPEIEKKRRSDIKFHPRNEDTAWIFDRLNRIIGQINDQFYNYDLNGFLAFQYSSYNSEEKGTSTMVGSIVECVRPAVDRRKVCGHWRRRSTVTLRSLMSSKLFNSPIRSARKGDMRRTRL
jgi:hypothetical protein